jgi:hypothetical protein
MSWHNLARIAKSHKGVHLDYMISGEKAWPLKTSHLFVARHWNSDSPIIPRRGRLPFNDPNSQGAVGGGYFLRHRGIGIAIDPGHAFLKTIYEKHDICAADIDVIIITHFHQDHCGDIANCLTMARERKRKPIIFAPIPVQQYITLLEYRLEMVSIFPGMEITLSCNHQNVLNIEFLPTLHWQTITPDSLNQSGLPSFIDYHMSAVGIKFTLLNEEDNNRQVINDQQDSLVKTIVITGDTMFPTITRKDNGMYDFSRQSYDLYLNRKQIHINLEQIDRMSLPTLRALLRNYFSNYIFAYLNLQADLVCYHIGSIEEQFTNLQNGGPLNFQYNGHHLGILGIIRLMRLMDCHNQRMGIITEWGEELRGERKNIAKFLGKQFINYSGVAEEVSRFKCLPSDVDLIIDLNNGLIGCSDHQCFHSYLHMEAEEASREYLTYQSSIKNPNLNRYENTCDWQ